jgi:hypothetical protein
VVTPFSIQLQLRGLAELVVDQGEQAIGRGPVAIGGLGHQQRGIGRCRQVDGHIGMVTDLARADSREWLRGTLESSPEQTVDASQHQALELIRKMSTVAIATPRNWIGPGACATADFVGGACFGLATLNRLQGPQRLFPFRVHWVVPSFIAYIAAFVWLTLAS